ncbi:hypothetical protein [Psychrobacter sp. I-STPA10]|uniref:hypothetical protein n=1 Tax=Psychrobacter sp. I-STPA10 TaxID=2585769 RepID=UPI001E5715CA|nr:hypothetical protein [Psychrobacter sp. I-STPA10]
MLDLAKHLKTIETVSWIPIPHGWAYTNDCELYSYVSNTRLNSIAQASAEEVMSFLTKDNSHSNYQIILLPIYNTFNENVGNSGKIAQQTLTALSVTIE